MFEKVIYKKDGVWKTWGAVGKYLSGLADGKYFIKIESVTKRSIPQNRYLHGVLIPEFRKALYEAGHENIRTDEIAKDVMKMLFLKTTVDGLETVKHTSGLTKEEMSKLIDDVIIFCGANLNYSIPYPGEKMMMNFENEN